MKEKQQNVAFLPFITKEQSSIVQDQIEAIVLEIARERNMIVVHEHIAID